MCNHLTNVEFNKLLESVDLLQKLLTVALREKQDAIEFMAERGLLGDFDDWKEENEHS